MFRGLYVQTAFRFSDVINDEASGVRMASDATTDGLGLGT